MGTCGTHTPIGALLPTFFSSKAALPYVCIHVVPTHTPIKTPTCCRVSPGNPCWAGGCGRREGCTSLCSGPGRWHAAQTQPSLLSYQASLAPPSALPHLHHYPHPAHTHTHTAEKGTLKYSNPPTRNIKFRSLPQSWMSPSFPSSPPFLNSPHSLPPSPPLTFSTTFPVENMARLREKGEGSPDDISNTS